ncbi:hypothetical protein [uncultured Cohaesibacter sp.]
MSCVAKGDYLEDMPDDELIGYIDVDWLADYVAEIGLLGCRNRL